NCVNPANPAATVVNNSSQYLSAKIFTGPYKLLLNLADKAVSAERGFCFRSLSRGNCSLPLTQQIPKQICCCSRVGKGWGRNCEKCPLPGSVVFNEICPAGHGYHYSRSDVQISLRPAEDQDLVRISSQQHFNNYEGTIKDLSSAEQHSTAASHKQSWIEGPNYSFFKGLLPPEKHLLSIYYSMFLFIPTVTDICDISPNICGPGHCISREGSYTCSCDPGYHLDSQHTKYIDECEQDPCEGKGRCINMVGTHSCACFSGYTLVILQEKQTCQDINECEQPTLCRRGRCTNTPGSYRCDCDQGYIMTRQGQCDDIDECRNPTACPTGRCINTLGSFECVSCPTGYKAQNGRCLDENECLTAGVCENGKCINLDGSYRCICNQGFKRMADNKSCRDIDECASLNVCPNALCTNTEGSYICTSCPPGYGVSEGRCEDIDECASPNVCPNGVCSNTDGSYTCLPCGPGYRVSEDRRRCEDVNECLTEDICGSNRECMNTDGSYFCICAKGYTTIPGGTGCQDINECLTSDICGPNGECINNEDGSYYCLCAQGYITTPNGTGCQDWDECTEDARCAGGQCLNTDGSYMCKCETGFTHLPETEDCVDINECMNETICSVHEYCENTVGSFRCVCDRGFQKPPGEQRCVDINECEMMNRVCGAALCENFEGSFFCVCRDENEEFDPFTSQCLTPSRPCKFSCTLDRKDCYYNLNDANFCDNVLAQNITKEECCCTVGAGWGDNCEVHPCPVIDTDEYEEICPDGKGIIPFRNYEDADECAMFGSEICKNGRCVNTVRHYACYCHTGFHYDTVRLECIDNDECQDENTCVNGECVNTPGSFNCFCSPPLILDITRKKCINGTGLAVDLFEERNVHQGICWQEVGERFICNRPLMSRQTTYTECCCLYGEAWGLECAFCPSRTSDDFAQLCNIPRSPGDGSTGLRERPGYEYSPEGPEGPQYGQEIQQGAGTYYNYLQPEYGPYDAQRGPEYELGDPYLGAGYGIQNPRFEGLQAEECGILNGCENGRCVRVREGYTCDCFDGYKFDVAKMACVDINECEDVSDTIPLCRNAKCENTEGSYNCNCLPGYVLSQDLNDCKLKTEAEPQ
uniref:Latent-transforming growth factor beta-binding protein 1 n=1 Tax=Callorhinchus milii TaxID=7868 RepID=A0A4W3IAC2_CALMI